MQCASSITISPAVFVSCGSTLSRNPGLFSRSGLTSRTSTAPASISAWTCCHSSRLAELIVRAWMPARTAASTWLRISASSGETITVGPAPRARSSAVATKYTADLPQPVRCTTRTRRRPVTSSLIAVHWSSRSRASSPASARRYPSAAVRISESVMLHSYHEAGTAGPVRSIERVTDIVSIRDLRVSTVIGVYDWEREVEQALTFAIDMAADVAKAARHDDIKDTLDYSAVAQAVKAVVTDGKFQLIETAAEAVAQRLIADFGLDWVRVEVVKPIPS